MKYFFKQLLAVIVLMGATLQVSAQDAPARCADLTADSLSGLYLFDVPGFGPMQVFCDNEITAEGRKGGWMLVWSNLRGGGADPATDLSWWLSINTPPRISGVLPLDDRQEARQYFEIFTGLNWWIELANGDSAAEMVYEWSTDYSTNRRVDQQAYCPFRVDATDSYSIFFDAAACRQMIGKAGLPGLFTYHSGQKWTAMDADNDNQETNCSHNYSRTPFWYSTCWSGSINGSGEHYSSKHHNGAHWAGSTARFAKSQPSNKAAGAGNGWIYIRPKGAGH